MANKFSNFIKKISKRYRLSVHDTQNFTEVYSASVSKMKLWMLATLLFVAGMALVVLLFFYTPLKYIVPGYPSKQIRELMIHNSLMLDSLKIEIEKRDNYFKQIQTILSGNTIEKNTVNPKEKIDIIDVEPMESDTVFNSLIGPEKYKFSYFNNEEEKIEMSRITLFPPTKGMVVNRFGSTPGHYGTDIVGEKDASISAILPGTVLFAEWSVTTGYVIQIQHDYNLISIYKHNAEIFVKTGDRVKAGDLIAIMGNEGEYSTGPHLHFELWQNGIPLNPENYINF